MNLSAGTLHCLAVATPRIVHRETTKKGREDNAKPAKRKMRLGWGTIVVNSRWEIRGMKEGRKRLLANQNGAYPPRMHILLAFLSYADSGCCRNIGNKLLQILRGIVKIILTRYDILLQDDLAFKLKICPRKRLSWTF